MKNIQSKQRSTGATTFTSAAAHVQNNHLPESNRKITLPHAMQPYLPAVMKAGNPKFRLPQFGSIKSTYMDKKLKLSESVVQTRVMRLLERMEAEGKLLSPDPVPVIMKQIFPAPGVMDEAAFNAAVDVTARTVVYQSIADSHTKVESTTDKPKLDKALTAAATLCTNAAGNAAGLADIFGKKAKTAKSHYEKIAQVLEKVRKNMDKHISTDYNLDDDEVGLGGYALYDEQEMHLLSSVAKVTDPKETKVTLIHEAAHMADKSIDDRLYYGTHGFQGMTERQKITNAAHFEELPRRELGTSIYPKPMVPGMLPGGKATKEDKVKEAAADHLRMAWDAAVDTFTLLRGVRRQSMAGTEKPFKDNERLLVKISRLEDLTIHEQAKKARTVTDLDVTIAESIAHSFSVLTNTIDNIPYPAVNKWRTKRSLKLEMVAAAISQENNLLKDPDRDMKLTNWMVAHYRKLPSA
ncbi:hypothetical protein SAMN05444266_10946 [Chitinophaga jiangningensis]|uniref:Uncharacterized protein n=1 Tax=Chitinophaga jiangningensis TaxID=1419482 RepID=A0A1M7JWX4_9BACT|nr:hypothetical protein [Chitinophaga jiangningensis]SHM57223.1 hypothetical protein SAMN05444266_10946 [Chitinophaga jiangningensis]